ncbi:MAG TPA: hypothetical protein VE954_36390 [Oligoflexus sp.]|uniref:hypothetical protein n=1 Tax=Oligoflexus sp. TaxID=1971216 RepID=UPI002D61B8B6|nr:hypothetical protein [Oligoflexus sp.]HYX38615.1 hypothetical protein [Oligoflexus sp.]
MKFWTLALLLIGTSAWAKPIPYKQSLLKHGINASAYGEAVVQKDDMLNTDIVSGRMQGGWLLSRHRFLATTLGASYTGLLGNAQKAENGVVEYRYYGPILEVIALPESPLTPIFSYSYEHGYFKRSATKDDLNYGYTTMKMQELRFMLALSVGKYQQLVIGASGQDIQHQHFYKNEKDGDLYRRRGKRQENAQAYFAGFRLAAF